MYENIDDNGREVKCRKKHHCEWCGFVINQRESGIVRIYKWDGDFHNSHMHPECWGALNESMEKGLMWDGEFETGLQGRGCLVGVLVAGFEK